jgi:hypothetical protein
MSKNIKISEEYSLNQSCIILEPYRFNGGKTSLNKKEIGHSHCEGLVDISSILNVENEIFMNRQI